MHKTIAAILMALCLSFSLTSTVAAKRDCADVEVIRDGIHFAESVFPWDGGIFISNYESDNLTPRPDENKGNVLYEKDGVTKTVIPAAGELHKPLGLFTRDGVELFVCDTDTIKQFDLRYPEKKPKVISFEQGDSVNAMTYDGRYLYVSVTNNDLIYRIDLTKEKRLPEKWIRVPGPNGMATDGRTLYVVSIPHDFATPMEENVVYRIRDMHSSSPKLEKISSVSGLYDGAALSPDGKVLYVSDWKSSSVTAIDLKTGSRHVLYRDTPMGPADIAQGDGILYIPDLIHHSIIAMKLYW
ncbi:MAG: hypothetical protein LKE33_02415 [Acidaminococcus sp.]|jgi:DNA-binding beta-propeller fold protein YncE|nr:hypothetical protein [Acidaminococcus sp.]MCI2101082.1 hypothetical protein [Acidaminococcus sp.]MCI2115487.1 hypothetical protein [Acidaminococcus sp.]MCI2117609.1 hypothetical protein [Acidaminococcus sp.]